MKYQDRKNPKILMLGWEFPPIINGGLGVACHDLGVALSKLAKVTVILPKSIKGFVPENMELVGLNNVDVESRKIIEELEHIPGIEEIYQIPVDLDPYYGELLQARACSESYVNQVIRNGKTYKVLNIDSLYGGDVIRKVNEFASISADYASTRTFDVIHAHDWMTMLAGMEIKRRTGKPLAVHIHSLEYDRSGPESKGWVYQLEKSGLENADVIFPVSNFTGNIIREHYHISPEKVIPIHNGIRPVNAYRSNNTLKEKTVLFVGRLTRQKGPEYFVDIASRVLDKNPDVRFIMAGSGEFQNRLLEKSSFQKIGNRFHMTGFLNTEKVRHLLSIADVYCMPSISEPFGLSAAEAAQFGVPCVISRQSGVAEVLKGSLKFDYWDTHKAADYILRLLSDQVLKEKVVQDGYNDLPGICWNKAAEKVITAYSQIL